MIEVLAAIFRAFIILSVIGLVGAGISCLWQRYTQ